MTEVCVVLESVGLSTQISLDAEINRDLVKIGSAASIGAFKDSSQCINYIFSIIDTMFKMAMSCQFIIMDVEHQNIEGLPALTSDLVFTENKILGRYIDQDTPLLPAAR